MVSFPSSIMKNIVAPSPRSRVPVKLIFCIALGSASSACCLPKSIYRYHCIVFIEIIIIQQTTSCVIISLTCCNLTNVIICVHIIFNWLIKRVFSTSYNIVIFYFYPWKIISCLYFSSPLFSAYKTKSLFNPSKLQSTKKSKY